MWRSLPDPSSVMAPSSRRGNDYVADRESDFEQEHAGREQSDVAAMVLEIPVLSARNLKALMKQSGHRLSSNAFESMNAFVVAFLQCLARQIATIMAGEVESVQLHQPSVEIPWPIVISCVESVVPSLEGWFATWFTLLQQHLAAAHAAALPQQLPCCEDIAEKCSLVIPEECEKIFRFSMHPVLNPSYLVMASIMCTFNDIVHWIVRVSIRVLESKGLATLRRSEVSAVLQKAPIFERLHLHIHPQIPATISSFMDLFPKTVALASSPKPGGAFPRISDSTASLANLAMCVVPETRPAGDSPAQSQAPDLPSDASQPLEAFSPFEGVGGGGRFAHSGPPIQSPSLHINLADPVTPEDSPGRKDGHNVQLAELLSALKLDARHDAGPALFTRIVACTDPGLGWIKTVSGSEPFGAGLPQHTGVFVESRGVETDAETAPEAAQPDSEPVQDDPMSTVKRDLGDLKALVLKLVGAGQSDGVCKN